MFSKDELNHFYRYCLSLTYDEGQAYDILQSCLEKYLQRLAISEAPKNPNGYLMRMLKNQFIDQKRYDSKRKSIDIDECESDVISLDERTLEDITVDKNEVEMLLCQLDSDEREILFLWAVEGYTIQEISGKFSIPKGTLLSKIFRMKKRILNWQQTQKEFLEG